MTERKRVYSGAPWENIVGYCRAIKVGNQIFVSGTTSIGEDGKIFAPNDPYRQAKRCFEIALKSLSDLDCPISNIVRTRMFVTEIKLWEEFGRAHQEFFWEHPPATSMIEVKGLIDPALLIEVEVEAIL
ncbi:MAG: RidA family protein [Oligoflexales bacterium]|nr:RidA family protein [Oligoflexales bacterium]